jgi:hypothetical protein
LKNSCLSNGIGKWLTKTFCALLFPALAVLAQHASVPLIMEGNAPIVELSFTMRPPMKADEHR